MPFRLGELRSTIVEQISAAVNGATLELQQTLVDRLSKSLELTSQRIDDRVTKSKELQDALLNQLRLDQMQFQEEIRTTILRGKPLGGDEEADNSEQLRVFQRGFAEGGGCQSGGRNQLSSMWYTTIPPPTHTHWLADI